jgi:acyl-CoA thioester hydrolase
MMANLRWPLRVYYEDTDAGGVVYYANYLHFLERARSELLRSLGISQARLAAETGIAFVVRSLSTEFIKPARLDDALEVVTAVESLGRAQTVFAQRIERADETLVTASVRLACLDLQRDRATAIPDDVHKELKRLL